MTCPCYEELELRSLDFKSHTPHHYMIHKAFLNIIFWNILLPPTAFSWLWWFFFFFSLSFYVSNRAGHPEAEWIHTWQCITVGTLEVAGACMWVLIITLVSLQPQIPGDVFQIYPPPCETPVFLKSINSSSIWFPIYLQSQGSTLNTLHSCCFPGMFLDTHVGVVQRNRSESQLGTVLEFGLFTNTICWPYGLVDVASL